MTSMEPRSKKASALARVIAASPQSKINGAKA